MTFDDLDTWRVTYNQIVDADSESGMRLALTNDTEAQDGYKVRIITSEMSHGNGLWNA